MSIDPVLLRSKVLDKDGLMSREWVRQQIQLQSAAGQVSTITNNVTDIQVASGFDDRNGQDWQQQIWEAFLRDQTPAIRDFGPAIQDLQLNVLADSPRVYDDAELRNALAGSDAPNWLCLQPQIDELRALLAGVETPRSPLQAQTNGNLNGSQALLNLAAGSNVTLAESFGTVTISSSGGGGGSGSFSIDVAGTLVAQVVGGSFTFEVNTLTVATYS